MGKVKKTLNVFFSVTLLAVLVFVLFNRQRTLDWLSLLNYTPPDNIKLLADASTMSSIGRQVFYVHRPEVLNNDDFNKYCTFSEETIVLGCYNGVKIYLFDVSDPKLEGIEEVTAAHEMLHAQYDRLSTNEKKRINSLLESELTRLTDERIKRNIESYKKRDPSIVLNEAHSIFGTEVKTLSPELEDYYNKYFIDRKKIVSISESYEAVFTNIKEQVEKYDLDLQNLKTEIETRENDLEKRASELTRWSDTLEGLRNNGLVEEYNSQVYSYNSSVDKYRKDINVLKLKISEYNGIVTKRNELAMQQNNLYKSIDSKAKDL